MESLPEYGHSMPLAEGIPATIMAVVQIANPGKHGILTLDYGAAYTFADVPRCLPARTAGMMFNFKEFLIRTPTEFWRQPETAELFGCSSTDNDEGAQLRLDLFGTPALAILAAMSALGPRRYAAVGKLQQTAAIPGLSHAAPDP